MRILTLIHEYPPIGGGGGHLAQEVARGLVKLGHEVYMLAPHMNGLQKRSLDEGVHLTRIPSFRRKAYVGDLLAMSGYLFFGFFSGLWMILRYKPDVIHVHFAVPAGALAWTLSKLTGVPYVLTSHLGDVPGGVPEKTDRWFRWIYPFTPRFWLDAAAVTAISDFTRCLALSHYSVPIEVIPNGVDLNLFPNQTVNVNTPPQIVFAGRLVHQKHPEAIPQILHALADLDWRCVIVGDGPLKEATMQEIESLGLADRISLTGWKTPNEVTDILKHSDILLLPSRTEGIPMTVLQSLANGLAIVASRAGSVEDTVVDGVNGYLHAPDEVDGFIKSLRKLLTDPIQLQKFRNASREQSKKFDISFVVHEYEKALVGAVEKK